MVATEYNLARRYQNTSRSATVVTHSTSRAQRTTCAPEGSDPGDIGHG
jgi:hypothetical protein